MTRRPALLVRAAVEAAKCTVVGGLAFLAVGVAHVSTQDVTSPQQPDALALSGQGRLERLMERHDCSTTGFGPDVVPGSALVAHEQRVRRVSFDDGWAVYTGDRPGVLVAVCRAAL